jgi:acetyl esterase/lipase
MGLAPDVQQLVAELETTLPSPDFDTMTAEDEVTYLKAVREAALAAPGNPEPVSRVESIDMNGLPGMVYVPEALQEPAPVLMHVHPGGWVAGGLQTQDPTCRALANGSRAIVIATTHRLAPEHPFPAATDDCASNFAWTIEHGRRFGGDPGRVALMGSSSGGNVVASTCLRARDKGSPRPALQVLVYPVLDPSLQTRTYRNYGTGYVTTKAKMAWYWAKYTPDPAARSNPYAVPGCSVDLSGLPPAIVVTAECDPVRDEGETYASQMVSARVPVTVWRVNGQIHGFLQMLDVLPAARPYLQTLAGEIGARLGSTT